MEGFAERLLAFAGAECGIEAGRDRVVVAASGGIDSTVLLRTLVGLEFDVVAVHVHHGLRDDADADAEWVRGLGHDLGVRADVVRVRVGEGNVQAAARAARYAALAEAAERHGCGAVAAGHTASDQAETVLMNLARGAGLRGLGGMAPARPLGGTRLVRPLLWATREEVEQEAARQGWTWQEEVSNATLWYRRNRFRHKGMGWMEEEAGPGVAARLAATAAEARRVHEGGAVLLLRVLGQPDARGGTLPLHPLDRLSPAERHALWAEALAVWAPDAPRSRAIVGAIDRLRTEPVGRSVHVGGLEVWREREAIRLVRPVGEERGDVEVGHRGHTRTPWGTLHVDVLSGLPPRLSDPDPDSEVVDADRWEGPLTVRPWRAGDRIRPLGMEGTALVSDLLSARRVRRSDRASQLVLVDRTGRVLWVVGHRLSGDVAVTERTRRAVRWTWRSVAGPGAAP